MAPRDALPAPSSPKQLRRTVSYTRKQITATQTFGYSAGHILNDLCSACWFTYLIIYQTEVKQQSESFAGILMLVGQVADGLVTPLVGITMDKFGIKRYGKRKTWHALGTFAVIISFAFMFHKCFGFEDSSSQIQQLYYGAFIVLFQIGWASTQISHLSLIPVLTVCKKKIVFLNSIRSCLTFVCGIVVYLLMGLLLHLAGSKVDALGPGDERVFSVGLMYMFTRIAINVPQVYLPLYLISTLSLNKESIAYFPLVMLICSVIGSFLTRPLTKLSGKRVAYICGATLVVGSSFWFYFQSKDDPNPTYGATACIGVGCSIMLILSLSMTADLIGGHTDTAAFVYGSMSLVDKLSNGILIALIQHFHPEKCNPDLGPCSTNGAQYYRYTMSVIPGTAALLAALSTLLLSFVVERCPHTTQIQNQNVDEQGGNNDIVISNAAREVEEREDIESSKED
ncbi:major facilitator superfamily domain-containing protein 12-like [Bolinopsis microptera]|uniref:major facilitator superfamily domain-containing protein 12-like n=1 Tax=Bolinopsis microptera TaxID=2820187 RepID=UPI0030796031